MEDGKQMAAFKEMKLRLGEVALEDATIIRFLRARDYDVDKAEEMIRLNLEWRKENNISSYLNWRPSSPKFVCNFPLICTGHDFEGSPVIHAAFGRWKTKQNLKNGLEDEMVAFSYHTMETLLHHIRQSTSDQMTIIVDMAEVNPWDAVYLPTLQLYYRAFGQYEQHYPEILKKCLVVNASWLLHKIFNFMKPVFTGTTLQKIQVFESCERDKYMGALLDIMPRSSIPPLLL